MVQALTGRTGKFVAWVYPMTDPEQDFEPEVADGGAKAIDPVCGMTVDPAKTSHHADRGAHAYHFCSAVCLAKFQADPDRYLNVKSAAPAPEGAIYTCPMHPQIRQVGPGLCPICGMALEPETITAMAAPILSWPTCPAGSGSA